MKGLSELLDISSDIKLDLPVLKDRGFSVFKTKNNQFRISLLHNIYHLSDYKSDYNYCALTSMIPDDFEMRLILEPKGFIDQMFFVRAEGKYIKEGDIWVKKESIDSNLLSDNYFIYSHEHTAFEILLDAKAEYHNIQ